jgi:hypothetical protein
MMQLNDEQLERVARYLDGEALELTAEERQAVRQVELDSARLGPRLDVAMPPLALDKALALAGPQRMRQQRWRLIPYAASMAAAAALLLAVGLWMANRPADTKGNREIAMPEPTAEDIAESYAVSDEFDEVRLELRELESEILVSNGPRQDWLDDPLSDF